MARRRGSRLLLALLAASPLAVAAAAAAWVLWLPDVKKLKTANPQTTAYIELRRRQARSQGKTLELQWSWTPWHGISDHLKNAVLIAEDDMFWRHQGIDWENVKVAFAKNWEQKRMAYGASTITQQVARNLYLSPSKNPLRKLKELLITRLLERDLGKRRIFELYLNIAEWGKGIFGVEAAARAYFGKGAADLGPEESAALAAVLPKPLRLNPSKETRYVVRNRERILRRMRASGLLPNQAEETFAEDYALASSTPTALELAVPPLLLEPLPPEIESAEHPPAEPLSHEEPSIEPLRP